MKNLTNRVQLIGRLGADPEIIKLPNDNQVVRMTMATNTYYRNGEGQLQENTQWHNLKAWGKLGEDMANKLSKGNKVLITGQLEHRTYETNNGEKRKVTDVKVTAFELINVPQKKAADVEE